MIKNIKRIGLTLVAIFTGFILAGNVFAFEVGEAGVHKIEYKLDKNGRETDEIVKYVSTFNYCKADSRGNCDKNASYSDDTFTMNGHRMIYSGTEYKAYCPDPHLKSNSKGNANYVIERVLDPNNAKDAVILSIINADGYSYHSKIVALRAFLPYTSDIKSLANFSMPGTSKSEKGKRGQAYGGYANFNSGFVWGAEDLASMNAIIYSAGETRIEGLNQARSAKDLYNIALKGLSLDGWGEFTTKSYIKLDTVGAEAKKLFLEAIKVGAKVANGQKAGLRNVIYSGATYEENSFKLTPVNGVQLGSRTVKFDITFTGFNDEDNKEKVTVNVTPDKSGKMVSVEQQYKVAGTTDWKSFDSNTDFRSLLTDKSVTINFRVRVAANVPNGTTVNYSFGVNVGYEDVKTVKSSGALFVQKDNYEYQRFYIGLGDENPNTHVDKPFATSMTWSDTPAMCSSNVPDKKDAKAFKEYINICCRGNNEEGFKIADECERAKAAGDKAGEEKWCGLKEEYCDYCNDTVTVPQTCTEISFEDFENGANASIKGPEDIKVCVMDGQDQANNTYKLTKDIKVDGVNGYSFANNKYCSVSCKEDYDMSLPTARYVNSGREFVLKMDVKGTKTCYSDIINYELFNEDITRISGILSQHAANGTATSSNQEFKNALDEYEKAMRDIKACNAGWDPEYSFDPEINFSYQEEYIDNLLGHHELKFKQVYTYNEYKDESWYCTGSDINSKYDQCIGGSASNTLPTTTRQATVCTNNGGKYTCQTQNITIPAARFAKKKVEAFGIYAPDTIFYTKYSTGIVEAGEKLGQDKRYTKLAEYLDAKIPDGDKVKVEAGQLPVQLKTGKGVYTYGFTFNNVGEYFDRNALGRLIGGKDAVAFVNKDTKFQGVYVCSYVVNCKECEVKCIEPSPEDLAVFEAAGIKLDLSKYHCDLPNDCPECEVRCEGACIYDPNFGQLFTVHQTSITDFNSSNRTLGSNLADEKGQAFISEMEAKGESIYEDAEYSFTFTPAAIEFIRDVNKGSKSYIELASEWDNSDNYVLYSDLVKQRGGDASEIAYAKEHDYKIYQSSIITKLYEEFNSGKSDMHVNVLKQTRKEVVSWLDSDYCKSHNCAMVGTGPAYK